MSRLVILAGSVFEIYIHLYYTEKAAITIGKEK